jgi:serine phosphatase RsbU (regulator of sigma subunit)/anti-sigma regulatory factor (Ser/Thr protein kinase)
MAGDLAERADVDVLRRQVRHLDELATRLGDAVTVDEVARAALTAALTLPSVVRAGFAVTEAAGREFRFLSTDPDALTPLGLRWCTVDGLARVPLADSIRSGRSSWFEDLEAFGRRYPDLSDRQRAYGARSVCTLPLTTEDKVLGGLMLSFDEPQRFTRDERDFLSAFAVQVAQALRRGMAYQVERGTSERLQRSLLPRSLPDLTGLELGSYYRPGGAEVDIGGDWYDVLPLEDGSVVVSLGDVMGKGVPAALVMSEVRSALRAYALLDPHPDVLLPRLDRLVASLPSDQLVTLVYAVIPPTQASAVVVVAGHPPPLLVPAEGPPRYVEESQGSALGLGVGRGGWSAAEVALREGDTLLLYSDGLVETRGLPLDEGLRRMASRVEEMSARRRNPRELCARLGQHLEQVESADDITALAVTVRGQHAPQHASTDLVADVSAAGTARRFVGRHLQSWGVGEEQTATAQLCVSELVTNAVIHTGTGPAVTVRLDDECILVLVSDHGGRGAVRPLEEAAPDDISGRGLALVDALSSSWSAERNADGTTVWFELARESDDEQDQVQ